MEKVKETAMEFDYKKSLKKRDGSWVNRLIRVEKYINRPLAALIVKAVFNTPVTPNGLTFVNFFLGLVGAYCISRGTPLFFMVGGILVQLSAVVDCADGQLARAKEMGSSYGAHLDLFLDRVMDFILIVAIAVGLFNAYDDLNLLIIGLVSAGVYLLQINLFYIQNSFQQKTETGSTGEARALMLFMVFIGGVANILHILIIVLLVETVLAVVIRIFGFLRLGRAK